MKTSRMFRGPLVIIFAMMFWAMMATPAFAATPTISSVSPSSIPASGNDQANVKAVGVLTKHSNDESYYLECPRKTGNFHRQFAMIWAAMASWDRKQ